MYKWYFILVLFFVLSDIKGHDHLIENTVVEYFYLTPKRDSIILYRMIRKDKKRKNKTLKVFLPDKEQTSKSFFNDSSILWTRVDNVDSLERGCFKFAQTGLSIKECKKAYKDLKYLQVIKKGMWIYSSPDLKRRICRLH